MRSRPVRMAIAEPRFAMRSVPNHYELKPRGRLAWLQRLLWRALHKMGALSLGMEEVITHTVVTIDADRVIDQVEEARFRLQHQDRRPTRVMLGPKEAAEIMKDAALEDLAYGRGVEVRFPEYRGLTIEVVPHMQGALVL